MKLEETVMWGGENVSENRCVTRKELPKLLGCGQHTADLIARKAEARIVIGKRVLVYLPKVWAYLEESAN